MTNRSVVPASEPRFEATGVDAAEVQALYADFIAEADGPLGIDLAAETAKGPPADLEPPDGVLLLVRVDGEAAGLGGIRHLGTEVAEVKSMYMAPPFRGLGIARRLLAELEAIAARSGCRAIRLDTSSYLTDAIRLYRSAGYREVPDYNGNAKADLWFERPLASEPQL
ncbi:MAG: GNAT family N-acetyltransferase [Solirubrobacterales bacterium]